MTYSDADVDRALEMIDAVRRWLLRGVRPGRLFAFDALIFLLPQRGRGPKHKRAMVFVEWQQRVVDGYPRPDNAANVAVARRDSARLLDQFIGPKH
jgi:hypothetical protein